MKYNTILFFTISALFFSAASQATSDAYVQPRLNSHISSVLSTLNNSCQNFTLDTNNDHAIEPADHHQSFVLSHRWSDGSALGLISHSETGNGEYGQIVGFKINDAQFAGPSEDIIVKDNTMPLEHKIFITEQHPSGIAWLPAPTSASEEHGYLFIASENENKVRIQKFNKDNYLGEIAVLQQNYLSQITDVWLAQEAGYNWLITHNMNAGTGVAYKALTHDLFQYGTANQGELDINAFTVVNQYNSPSDTGCGKSFGQNAQLVKDATNQWYVVHTYTGDGICGINSGSNIVKAYPASFNTNGTFSVTTNSTPWMQSKVGSSLLPDGRGGDGAAGFRVSKDGRLVAYYGGQYAKLSLFHWKTSVKECASEKEDNYFLTEARLFDSNYYASTYPDLQQAFGFDHAQLFQHWIQSGKHEGRSPSSIYMPDIYRANNIDLTSLSNEQLFNHFLTYGFHEGRVHSSIFHAPAYLQRYADLADAYTDRGYYSALLHWLSYGRNEGRNANPL